VEVAVAILLLLRLLLLLLGIYLRCPTSITPSFNHRRLILVWCDEFWKRKSRSCPVAMTRTATQTMFHMETPHHHSITAVPPVLKILRVRFRVVYAAEWSSNA
jgi:hypothetical protein